MGLHKSHNSCLIFVASTDEYTRGNALFLRGEPQMLARKMELGSDVDRLQVTAREVSFAEDDIIVSKTDAKGIMTYVNDIFLDVSGYTEAEMIGKPHNVIRHPDMPRCVFRLLWDAIKSGNEIFAYVMNRCKNGDHYWVLAHVTPTFGDNGQIVGYHSNRRVPSRAALSVIQPLYTQLLMEEQKYGVGNRAAVDASTKMLMDTLAGKGVSYDQFIHTL
jgi:PAS domain S-box-containing protein